MSRPRAWRRPAAALTLALLPSLLAAGVARADVVAGAGSDTYALYAAPATNPGDATNDGYNNAVEPSIGADWKTGKTLFQADLTTYEVAIDQATHTATWTPHKPPTTSQTTLDPILYTDSAQGRTIVSQLAGNTTLAALSDDDGATSTPVAVPGSGVDHQSVGGGPFAPGPTGTTALNGHAYYYCSQAILTSFCSISLDGGQTFNQPNTIYTVGAPMVTGCGGLHGHVRVRPDGTAMVPDQGCGPNSLVDNPIHQGVAENATNNVGPWTIDLVPDSAPSSNSDPSVSADAANTMYFGYENGTDAAGNAAGRIAVKKAGGGWAPSADVGAPLGVKSIAFPEVIAGSAGRAAFAFLGTTTPGNYQAVDFQGAWQLYIARTEDSGTTWRTTQVTTDEAFPVQRGCIQLGGPCTHRNLYDFNDITVDKLGRPLVGFADGCLPTMGCKTGGGAGANPADDTNAGVIARQECGTSLFAAQDAALAALCGSATTPVVALPEAPVVPLLLLGGGAAVVVTVTRRRRRATRAAA